MSFIDTKNNFEKRDLLVRKVDSKPTTYSIGDHLFQLNSYTDEANKKAGHASQTLQFDTEGLKDLQKILQREFPELNAETSQMKIEKVKVSLLDKNGEPQYGLNWGQRTGREPNQAYVQLPIEVYRSDFFPKKPEHFFIHTDDNQDIKFTRAQKTDEGTALQTPDDNSLFGRYMRDRLGIPHGQEITAKDILNYGCTEITFFKINGKFYLDFSKGNAIPEKSKKLSLSDSRKFSIVNSNLKNEFSIRYTTSLLSKPFTILAGNSGTGKTKIAKDLATWLGKKDENTGSIANKLIVPVGSDWTDNTKILGFYNPLKKTYESTKILDFILLARENPEIPFFLILDEMNLSHVERYFSDFLSAMESHEKIILYSKDEDCDSNIPESIDLPENLFVTGTVNIDETTYMFSPKVLDRANVIEFIPAQSDVLSNFAAETQPIEIEPVNDGSAEGFLALAKTVRETTTLPAGADICKTLLEGISNILDGSGFEFAFRTAKEIRLYINAAYALAQNDEKTLSEEDYVNLMDEQLLQKILPKVHGNRSQVGTLLSDLSKYSEEQNLKESKKKIDRMLKQLETSQFTSFI